MARKTIKQRIALDGGKEMEAQLKQLGAAGENAFDRISKAAAQADFAKFGQSLGAFGNSLQAMGKRLAIAFAGVTTVTTAAAAGIASIAKSGAEAADAAGKAAQAAGLQIDAYGRLAFAAEQNDVAADAFGAAMSRLNKALGEVQDGTKGAKDKFTALGVSVTDSHGKLKPTETIVQDLAEAFSKMPDGVKKSSAAIEIFGKSGASLIPFLNSGRDGLIDVGKTAERLGIVFTDAQKEIGDAMGDALDEVSSAAQGMKNQIGLLFAPTITAAAERLRDVLITNRDAILGFARSIADTALPIIQDFISALAGDDKAVRNNWVLEWRDAVVDFGKSAKTALTDIFIPALAGLRKALDVAAVGLRLFTLGGVNISGTTLGIALVVGQLTRAFAVLRTAIQLVAAALPLLIANPVVAAVAALAAGVLYLATRQSDAVTAAENHKKALGELDTAIALVKAGVPGAGEELKKLARIHLDAAEAALKDAQAQVDVQKLAVEAAKQSADLSAVGGMEKRLGTDIGSAQRRLEEFQSILRQRQNDIVELQQKIASASADSVKAVEQPAKASSQAADTARKNVEALGKTITVHTTDGGKIVQQTFDLVDGVAKAADASKQSLDGVSESAAKAGESVSKVKDDVSNLIIHVPEELKGQPTVADAMTQGLSDVPAAAKAAADGIIAEVSRVPQAIAGAISGGVQQGQGAPGGGGIGGDGTQQAAQPTGGIADKLAKPFEEARDRIAAALTIVPTAVTTALQTVQTAAAEVGAGLGDALVTPFETMASRIPQILESMTSAVRAQFDAMLAAVNSAVTRLQSAVASLESLAARAEAAASRARSATANAGGDGLATGGLVGRFAGGGRVSGPGSGTSDSILARLSNGEFVIRKRAVDKYGSEFFAALNSARLSGAQLLSRLRQGFANGGPVDFSGIVSSLTTGMGMPRLVPAFADGGAVASGGGRPINLTIDSQTYEMIAPDDVADRLAKYVARKGLHKAGKTPSWRK
ncbi:phage tail tape measure protein [Rhizobium sp. N4311]|uniref:phage tail tape measure protein n=1 Tax=Rhizobium sp. N4311 TaxID=1703972 RepID=UPI000B976E49|nr:phage tail tape measure protein [Rhizobium sp. N4311]OYD05781.1 phage-related minor tail protein [Rhizobium sp. N4311]